MKKQPLLSPHLEVGSRESVLWFSFLASQRWHPLPGECPEAGSCGVTNASPPPKPPAISVCTPSSVRGSGSNTQISPSINRDRKEMGAPYLCDPIRACVRSVPLGRRGRDCRRLHSPAASHPCPRATATLSPSLFTDGTDTAKTGEVAGSPNRLIAGPDNLRHSEDVLTALNYNVCCFSLPIIDI